ncbi:hypothetical protein QQS21_007302 [Conoideocrella luteorostrata]|uniref:Alpha-galactosidase n=1 Tax=Conoideocrella luteorostrata TaxID=1105319 RepID=A0AAJ0CKZ7_9HYPO|nr:hypothetical protein QQS21_007302 [Conoideocrella luteorostrata]
MASVQSYPPLGQVTIIQDSSLSLTSTLEISSDRKQDAWEVSLWISIDDGNWREVQLNQIEHNLAPQFLQSKSSAKTFLYFSCSVFLDRSAYFTLKFRHAKDDPWKWARDHEGLNDGIILLQSRPSFPGALQPCMADLNSEWKVSSRVSQSPGTQLWSLQCPIPASSGQQSAFQSINLGTPWGSFLRWFALVRHQPAWLAPQQGKTRFIVNQDAILCCFLSFKGETMALLAANGIDNMSVTFQHTDTNTISVHARNDSDSPGTVKVLISQGGDFDHAVASVMYEARSLVSPYVKSKGAPENDEPLHNKLLSDWKPQWYDGLGFCTWNSLGQQLSEEKLLHAVESLAKNDIRITNFIVDDNWQSLDRPSNDQSQTGWAEFEADKKAFPNGLKSLTAAVRKLHPNIQNIFVWHALLGYWGGISSDGAIAKAYKTVKVAQKSESQPHLTIIAKEDISRFYDDFYLFLIESGIDGVKTDVQVMIDLFESASDRGNLMSVYLDEWAKASRKHFGAKAISCMSQFPHALFYAQLPQNQQEIVVRNSDDYFPDRPSTHPWHVWANAHNAIFTRFLNVVPDWDMFQTVHEYSGFHAAARCVSGGPIYITDVPGEHNLHLIKQMTATTPLGQTIILRPSSPGGSIHSYENYEDGSLLKIGGYNGASQNGTGILGIFNISRRRTNELVPLISFPGIVPSIEYVIRAHTTGKTSDPVSIGETLPLITISLDVQRFEILCAFPVTAFEGSKYGNGHTGVLGLIGKMTGCSAITSSSIIQSMTGTVVVTCSLKALGTLGQWQYFLRENEEADIKNTGIYISRLAQMDIGDDFMVTIKDMPVPLETVQRSTVDSRVLEIDVEQAWKLMGPTAQLEREVQVKVAFAG